MSMAENLIPGLPDEIARECLIRVPYNQFPVACSVSKPWVLEIDSPQFHGLRRSVGLARPIVAIVQARPALSPTGPAKKFSVSAVTPSYRLTLYHPSTGEWAPLPDIPGGAPLFCGLAAAGRELVVVGGWNPETWATTAGVHVYSFATGEWRRGAPMPGPRRSFFACAAAATSDRRRGPLVLVAGGHDEEKTALRSALAYDVAADRWAQLPDMAVERDECRGVATVVGGKTAFHVIGGYCTERQGGFCGSGEAFDVDAWRWGPVVEGAVEPGTCPRACAAGGRSGVIYTCAAGGRVAAVEGGTWREVAAMPAGMRAAAPQIVGWEGAVMVVGSGRKAAAHVLELGEMTWREVRVPSDYAGHVQALCCLEI